ncbi:MAG: fibronectin type III-like domain-contianing protein [Burkholderiaceae bacterium]|nr:fibronectin type III-like domain-contianing protein [Burkholderiaceae bacterium]
MFAFPHEDKQKLPRQRQHEYETDLDISLQPGETRTVSMTISPKLQSVWDSDKSDWVFVADSSVDAGASSRDIRLSTTSR